MEAGIVKAKIAQVIGMGDTAPLKPDDPGAAVNRRISITLLNKKLDDSIKGRTGSDADINFINGDNAAEDARTPVINQSGTLLQQLREQRERQDNTYDNPPNKGEIFW
jgi:chemotaxis protein MotB